MVFMGFQGRKAQTSGTGAAVLVAIIAALIVLYILFLPPESREELLEGKPQYGQGPSGAGQPLLLATPGRLDYLPQKEIEHTVPPITLFSTTNTVVLKSVSTLYVKNAWFDKVVGMVTFSISDLPNTDNVYLSFNAKTHTGRLSITLNGQEVLNNEITTLNVEPIRLSKDLLQAENTLEFKVSDVGFAFWRSNEYALENVRVTGDVTDITTREARAVFLVTATEKDNLEGAFLRFFPDCRPEEAGILDVYLNDHNVFSSVPDCGYLREIEISPTLLNQGENTIRFRTNRGAYLIDTITLKSKLKEAGYPTFYFEVPPDLFAAAQTGAANIVLSMEFPDDIELKRAELFINGHQRGLDTRERVFTLGINPFVQRGNNVIEIKPRTTMDIVNLRVTVG
ncbi:hypothetical protein HY488_01215 [Candidatus Woesearchaeota archaeon]|nr:hypothetical protein [Candidatus Woesearchaeota archaeon]